MNVVFGCRANRRLRSAISVSNPRELAGRAPAFGVDLQFEPSLVGLGDRLEKRLGLGRVDQHGHAVSRAGLPHGVELGIVHRHATARGALHRQSEVLEDLQAPCAGLEVGLEPGRGAIAVAGLVEVGEVEVCEEHHAIGRRTVGDDLEARCQARAGASAEIHEHLQVLPVHLLDDLGPPLRRQAPVVAVDVDDGVLRARHRVFGHHERGLRLVLADAEILRDRPRR